MRCKNCGWDNPAGNVRCEKCNAQLNEYQSDDQTSYFGHNAEEMNPRATVAGLAPDGFAPSATALGCAACGYPIRPGDTVCPMCGHAVVTTAKPIESDLKQEIEVEKPERKIGTIIQGATYDKEKADLERKKLTGFLVSYSRTANGEFFPLYEGKNVIGRAASSNISFQGDSAISDRHLSILYRAVDRKFKFKDEQSSNGTFINGQLVDEGELKNFDMIRIGATNLLFIEIPLSSFE
ncbi:MAG: FHA domain-containing protein [Tannerella sp.]|jgi:uncharacterized Zn finger protein (UPF0148 family)|nr:FHA domain-containing protein [Tannerella sp.]